MRRYNQRQPINDNTIDGSSCWLVREYADDATTALNNNDNTTVPSDGPAPSNEHRESPPSPKQDDNANADNDRQAPPDVNSTASLIGRHNQMTLSTVNIQ